MRHIGLTILVVLASLQAEAQVYKWIDESGHTQFSDRPPPPGVKFEKFSNLPAPDPTETANRSSNSATANEFEFRKRQLAAEEKQKLEEQKEKQAKARQETCDNAKSRLRSLEDGGRIFKPNANGDREYMGNDEIEAERILAQKRVDEDCK